MIAMAVGEVQDATGGSAHGGIDRNVVVTGVATDSRRTGHGDLFVAIPGDRTDGHDHVTEALAAGAVAVLAEHEVPGPALVVDSSIAAVGQLAAAMLTRLQAHGGPVVVGITGSVGKTSTKDLLGQLLAGVGPTIAPHGSFNNDLGLPTTVLRCDEQTRFLVLEYGARGLGHISRLTSVAAPGIAVVLGVGSSHLGEFGSVEAIAAGKSELVVALPAAAEGGVAVLNADDPLVMAMAERTAARVVTFGMAAGADVRATDVRCDAAARHSFRLHVGAEMADVELRLPGAPSVQHALAAAAVATEVGMSTAQIAAALADAVPVSAGRLQITESTAGVTVIDDSYNASPESVRAALATLATLAVGPDVTRRTWAVLGEMRELGASSVTEHADVGRLAVSLGIDRVVVVGAAARAIHQGALDADSGAEAVIVPDVPAAIALLGEQVRAGDVVLVKASRSIGLERVAAALLGPGAQS